MGIMKTVLLDTCIVDAIIKKHLKKAYEFLKDKKVYISMGTLIELTGKGFNNRESNIDYFIKLYDVNILMNTMPIMDKELQEYPLSLDINDYVGPKIEDTFRELRKSGIYQQTLADIDEAKYRFNENVERIIEAAKKLNINYDNFEDYRAFLKSRFKLEGCKHKIRLKNLPFNTIIRAFTIEKFYLSRRYNYKPQDFCDLMICFNAIYFDYFIVENNNYNILQKLINIRRLNDIFQEGFNLMQWKDLRRV